MKIDFEFLHYAGEYQGCIESKKRYTIKQIEKLPIWINAGTGDYIINIVKTKKAKKWYKFILTNPLKLEIICMEVITK